MLQMWVNIILLVFLALCALWDGFKKEIPLVVVWIGIAAAVIMHASGIIEGTRLSIGISVLPASIFWIISFVTREKIGYGDGWVLLMIGLYVGFMKCVLILMAALVLESIILLVLLVLGKIHKDEEVAFVPFLLLGLGVVLCF